MLLNICLLLKTVFGISVSNAKKLFKPFVLGVVPKLPSTSCLCKAWTGARTCCKLSEKMQKCKFKVIIQSRCELFFPEGASPLCINYHQKNNDVSTTGINLGKCNYQKRSRIRLGFLNQKMK